MHSGGDRCTATSISREVTGRDIDELRAPVSHLIPSLNGPLLKAATCMYTLTPDEHFVLALHPEHPQVAIAAGFSGHGFKFTSVVGEILADLAVEGSTRHPIELFSPRRSAFQECGATSDESASA
jgi:sarcosine oxidase